MNSLYSKVFFFKLLKNILLISLFKNISDRHFTKLRALYWCCWKYSTKLFLRFCIFPIFSVWNLHDSLNCAHDAFRYQINRMCFAWGKWIWRKSQITMLWPFAPSWPYYIWGLFILPCKCYVMKRVVYLSTYTAAWGSCYSCLCGKNQRKSFHSPTQKIWKLVRSWNKKN